ncbi:hypothetical protein [Streptomyces sp. NPDC058989]|uniref:hypothetical protein n=1 Tax=Streptomyces sp. NPDC058989 TaxID=3346686 RepID=UPI0036879987
MLDKVIEGIEDGVKKTAKHLDDNMTRGVKQMAKDHHDNDKQLADRFKGLGRDGKKDPKAPNPGRGGGAEVARAEGREGPMVAQGEIHGGMATAQMRCAITAALLLM